VFAVQFVAISGSIAAPVGSGFRDFASSFAWANLQFPAPSFIVTDDVDKFAQRGRDKVRRRRLEAHGVNGTSIEGTFVGDAASEYLATLGAPALDTNAIQAPLRGFH
jgi:hypothetical protein